jgi:phage terminase small subunit
LKDVLTIKQQVFVSEYLIDGNSARAAIAAGYSKRSAGALASQLLANPKVAAAIYAKHMKRAAKFDISAERVLEGLGNLAFFDIRKLYKEDGTLKAVTELDDVTAQAICGIEIEEVFERFGGGQAKPNGNILKKVKLADRGINLERLGRYHKLFTDKLEVTGLEGLADALAKARRRRGGK